MGGPTIFSAMASSSPKDSNSERKRHHFVSVTYLKSWAEIQEKLYAYRSDDPAKSLHIRPENIGFEKYYYSQIREDGSRDNDSFGNIFGNVEARWPMVLHALNTEALNPAILHWLFAMLTMMRARVPAARDCNEALMALETRTGIEVFAEMGKLPEKLMRYENELDTVEITVNRQKTLGTMSEGMRRFGDMTRRLGFEILCDDTGTGFITSDNPVAYFDPKDRGIHHPYIENTKVELYFPLSPRHILHGANRLQRFGHIPRFRKISDRKKVHAINRITSRFAYRLAFAADRSHEGLIQRHAATSPVLDADVVRKPGKIEYHIGHKFAARPVLPKFRPETCEDDLYEEDFRS